MKAGRFFVASALGLALLGPMVASAQSAFTSLHPEEAIPDPQGEVSPGPYSDFIKRVQEELHRQGFDAGPMNGDFGEKTQAALAQFQLAFTIPASGALDDETLAALGVQRESQTAAGPPADASAGAPADASAGAPGDASAGAPAEPSNKPPAEPSAEGPKPGN
jgi:peptidoglycan hydrolase-like protein with peptidoglycan-binding domain